MEGSSGEGQCLSKECREIFMNWCGNQKSMIRNKKSGYYLFAAKARNSVINDTFFIQNPTLFMHYSVVVEGGKRLKVSREKIPFKIP